MNNVTIKEKYAFDICYFQYFVFLFFYLNRVALENSIVCEGATIETGSVIKGCLVGSHHVVEQQSEHVNEVLTDSERLMAF